MTSLTTTPFFGIILTLLTFKAGVYLSNKTKSPFLNPLLISVSLIIIFLVTFKIPLGSYQVGSNFITLFLTPATAILAVSIYKQMQILKQYFVPVVLGCLTGALTSVGSAYALCKLFKLDEALTASLICKSVTTPIAIEICKQGGGIIAVTMAAVLVAGITGAVLSPFLVKLLRIKNPVAVGVAIGACSHALGTTKAIEMGEIEGAMGGVSIGISGIITVLLTMVLYSL